MVKFRRPITITMDPGTWSALQEAAVQQNCVASRIIEHLVRAWLAKQQKNPKPYPIMELEHDGHGVVAEGG